MKARTVMRNGRRLLLKDRRGNYYVMEGDANPGEDVLLDEDRHPAMMSFLHAIAVLNGDDHPELYGSDLEGTPTWTEGR